MKGLELSQPSAGELGALAALKSITTARFAIWYVEQVDRLEIIAAIAAEIERLQHARFVIVQSATGKRSNGSGESHGRVAKVGKKQPVARDSQSIGWSHAMGPMVIQEKPQVLIARIPPNEPPKRREVMEIPPTCRKSVYATSLESMRVIGGALVSCAVSLARRPISVGKSKPAKHECELLLERYQLLPSDW